ncbi:hypothetical protein [Cellulomonas chengniuliangii]|uniref:ScoMcrA-like N-terminal head domain-containing protein n=1 Tax=Cellulomonas chengniuliangii TaxID=2968084 RepID=A0ABY5KY17_9CELL|nr:hypothetical protein [Cellulomonas chengniuliangii]MCC2309374.1 hypothetical protein [Cellulomonas chengniuliangii]MCC2316645.1 hypothetical protein [Cellulomonas chengniuliangii]UUI75059.1 hypothetical protein NP064_14980 [Cellulomonas chengniuliangii]
MAKQHILQAIAEYDDRGSDSFHHVFGLGLSTDYTLLHEGRSYDAKAILGVAHRFATGRLASVAEVDGGLPNSVEILRKRGFEVTEPASASRAAARPARAARAPRAPRAATTTATRPAPVREAPVAICPTCSMTLPATGVCDTCS